MRMILAALAVAGCSFQSMAWHVGPETTVDELDARYATELAALEANGMCDVGDPTPEGSMVSGITECRSYHLLWRHYHAAKREVESR